MDGMGLVFGVMGMSMGVLGFVFGIVSFSRIAKLEKKMEEDGLLGKGG
ncbi:hypothetical protein RSO41_05135 [Halomonas sp. I1]|nr:hypothetical protein [Halomonas sp. I1]MDT8894031.1 hypothetical protein [Halomonas sp. I1]